MVVSLINHRERHRWIKSSFFFFFFFFFFCWPDPFIIPSLLTDWSSRQMHSLLELIILKYWDWFFEHFDRCRGCDGEIGTFSLPVNSRFIKPHRCNSIDFLLIKTKLLPPFADVGRHVYTADERFQILRPIASSSSSIDNEPLSSSSSSSSGLRKFDDEGALINAAEGGSGGVNLTEWILQIQFVQQRDAGLYICQVKTIIIKYLFVFFLFSCDWYYKIKRKKKEKKEKWRQKMGDNSCGDCWSIACGQCIRGQHLPIRSLTVDWSLLLFNTLRWMKSSSWIPKPFAACPFLFTSLSRDLRPSGGGSTTILQLRTKGKRGGGRNKAPMYSKQYGGRLTHINVHLHADADADVASERALTFVFFIACRRRKGRTGGSQTVVAFSSSRRRRWGCGCATTAAFRSP